MQTDDKLIIRLPGGLRDTIKRAASENERTMNAEVIYHLKRAYGDLLNAREGGLHGDTISN